MSSTFHLAWPVAILLLPWQTRFILVPGSIDGWPWEQGTVAIYASWLIMAVVIATGFMTLRATEESAHVVREGRQLLRRVAWPLSGLALLIIASVFTASLRATILWWVNVGLLGLFVSALVRNRVAWLSLARWFVVSLVPHAVLGIGQFLEQQVYASTLLGMAAQQPWVGGTSVVEHGLYRVLRSYGGFPHPNILGGWLSLGLILLPVLARYSRSKLEALLIAGCVLVFSLTLIFTFSRGAWLAAILGLLLIAPLSLRGAMAAVNRQAVSITLSLIVCTLAFGVITQWDHVVSRLKSTERLERWSLTTRREAIMHGVSAWRERPWFGWGMGASALAAIKVRSEAAPRLTPEPPHLVPLVVLEESGLFGLTGVVILISCLSSRIRRRLVSGLAWPLAAVTLVMLLFDHYLWTTWSGQSLAALLVAFYSIQQLDV